VYGRAPDFGGVSRSMCFGRGEGLPGRVWEEGRPVILKDLQGGYFQRAAAAKAAGLRCAVAYPVYFDALLKAVVVLLCGDAGAHSGAIEVWSNDPRVTSDLTLMDGVYGTRDAAFEAVSRQTYLPRGSGLPGLAWQRQGSVFIEGLQTSSKFVRGDELAGSALQRGLAFACPVPTHQTYVLSFLSSAELPIAQRIEGWVAAADATSLRRAYGFDERGVSLPAADVASAQIDPAILQAFAGAVPQVGRAAARSAAGGAQGSVAIALPLVVDGAVAETVAMYF
jgi:hypothetical protein